ncbi:MAG: zinc-ribbon domain-containing protein [Myxococcota bacterium]
MIAVCPKCSARYRVDTTRVGPDGAKLRCSKCSALFLVRVPAPSSHAHAAPAVGPSGGASPGPSAPTSGLPESRASRPVVVVADRDANRAKASADAMGRLGIGVHLVHDGVEAMLAIQRVLPRVVVLDAMLPRMTGLEVCEIVKRNESLRSTHVVLIGGSDEVDGDASSAGFGPDDRLEAPDVPDGLGAILQVQGLASGVAPSTRPPAAAPSRAAARPSAPDNRPGVGRPAAPPPATAPASAAGGAAAGGDAAREEERERARRLARIAVSEMLLYQPEKFAQACRDGTLERALEVEIQEARALIRQRIGPDVRAEADFVLEELHRVARERGAQA